MPEMSILRINGVDYEVCDAVARQKVQVLSNDNLLTNWYFANPVNQRGQTDYDGSGYTIDRWSNGAISVVAGEGIKATYASSIIIQKLEPALKAVLDGRVCTISVLCDGVMNTANFTYRAAPEAPTTIMYGETAYANILTSGAIHLAFKSAGSIMQAAKLELGDTQTLAHQENGVWVLNEIPDYGEELAKCQRYALFGRIRGVPTNRWGAAVGFAFPTPVTMRGEAGAPSIVGTFVVNCTDSPEVFLNFTVHNTLSINNDIYVYGMFNSSEDAAKATAMYFEPGNGFSMDL